MQAFRIADRRHTIFSGTGAYLHGGRWNSPGKRVIYAAQTYAGALLEVLVHASLGVIPKTHSVVAISIPDTLTVEILASDQLTGWSAEDGVASRRFGDQWLTEIRSAVLVVPSAALQGRESNVLVNPDHAEFARITASAPEPVSWDPRLFSSVR